jgi:hypothetical protein
MSISTGLLPYLYVASDGTYTKIGITSQPEIRIKNLTSPSRRKHLPPVRMVKVWLMIAGCPSIVERAVIKEFKKSAVRGREWFSTSCDEIIAFVETVRPKHLRLIDGVWVEQYLE